MATVNWTRDGKTGMTTHGWMICEFTTATGTAFKVFDDTDAFVGMWNTREDATAAVRG